MERVVILSFEDFVNELADATQRADVLTADVAGIQHLTLAMIGLDSLEIVIVGSVLLDHLPRDVEIPDAISREFTEATLGELYHLYAAAAERQI